MSDYPTGQDVHIEIDQGDGTTRPAIAIAMRISPAEQAHQDRMVEEYYRRRIEPRMMKR